MHIHVFIKKHKSSLLSAAAVPEWELSPDVEVEQVILDEQCEVPETEEVLPIPEIEIEIPFPQPESEACEDKNAYPAGWNAENIIF